jgi:hypothetical protein
MATAPSVSNSAVGFVDDDVVAGAPKSWLAKASDAAETEVVRKERRVVLGNTSLYYSAANWSRYRTEQTCNQSTRAGELWRTRSPFCVLNRVNAFAASAQVLAGLRAPRKSNPTGDFYCPPNPVFKRHRSRLAVFTENHGQRNNLPAKKFIVGPSIHRGFWREAPACP